jgi:hypothetical protein
MCLTPPSDILPFLSKSAYVNSQDNAKKVLVIVILCPSYWWGNNLDVSHPTPHQLLIFHLSSKLAAILVHSSSEFGH